MKKLYALLMAGVMLFAINTTVFALERDPVISPEPETTTDVGETSPKTGDLGLLTVGLAGVTFATTGIVAAKKSR